MKIKVTHHCDRRMTEPDVIEFVTDVYRAAEGAERASHGRRRVPEGVHYIELSITPLRCEAWLVCDGRAFGKWDAQRREFYPMTAKPRLSNPFILK